MRHFGILAAAPLLTLCACGTPVDAPPGTANQAGNLAEAPPPATPTPATPRAGWDLQSSGEGAALVLSSPSGGTAVRLFCPAGADRLLVNVPGLRAVASEERMSLGSRGEVVALVADPNGDRQRGGVTATGAIPANLAALIAGPVAVNYGAQNSGPHPAPPADLARNFVPACTAARTPPPPPGSY